MKIAQRMAACLLAAACLLIFAFAQEAQTDSSPRPATVTVGFLALDHDKHPYADLKQSDLTILDNKQNVQTIISLKKGSELPLRLGFLIDASNSQRHNTLYKPGVMAATDFLNEILKGPEDKLFVVKVTMIPEASNFMSMAEFRNYRLNAAPEGGTALYDGVAYACDSRMKTDELAAARRVLIVLSDGEDNLSHITRDAAVAKAIETGVVIFSVSTGDDSASRYMDSRGDITLKHLAEETGGEAFTQLDAKKMVQTFSAITEAINNLYFVTFESADAAQKGFHRIELKVSGKEKIRIQAPKGFYLH